MNQSREKHFANMRQLPCYLCKLMLLSASVALCKYPIASNCSTAPNETLQSINDDNNDNNSSSTRYLNGTNCKTPTTAPIPLPLSLATQIKSIETEKFKLVDQREIEAQNSRQQRKFFLPLKHNKTNSQDNVYESLKQILKLLKIESEMLKKQELSLAHELDSADALGIKGLDQKNDNDVEKIDARISKLLSDIPQNEDQIKDESSSRREIASIKLVKDQTTTSNNDRIAFKNNLKLQQTPTTYSPEPIDDIDVTSTEYRYHDDVPPTIPPWFQEQHKKQQVFNRELKTSTNKIDKLDDSTSKKFPFVQNLFQKPSSTNNVSKKVKEQVSAQLESNDIFRCKNQQFDDTKLVDNNSDNLDDNQQQFTTLMPLISSSDSEYKTTTTTTPSSTYDNDYSLHLTEQPTMQSQESRATTLYPYRSDCFRKDKFARLDDNKFASYVSTQEPRVITSRSYTSKTFGNPLRFDLQGHQSSKKLSSWPLRQNPLRLNGVLQLQNEAVNRYQRYLPHLDYSTLPAYSNTNYHISSTNHRSLRPQRSLISDIENNGNLGSESHLSTIRLQQINLPSTSQASSANQVYPQNAVYTLASASSANNQKSLYAINGQQTPNSQTTTSYTQDLQHQPQTLQIAAVPSLGFASPQQMLINNGLVGPPGGIGGFLDPFGRQMFVVAQERRSVDWTIFLWVLIGVLSLPVIAGAFFVPVFLKTVAFIIQLLQTFGLLMPISQAMVASQVGQQQQAQVTGKT